ncbi:MAG: radical SAM-associated putative lipoprotein [Tannerella sp.]|jgi:putative lipoprotein (rSAM/lipoprotein system)|nr:radical SAM-associated putative lipoprotein [Tannerella sp.]
MKKINRKFIKGTNWALAGLISLLGFSSCEEYDNGGESPSSEEPELSVPSNDIPSNDNEGFSVEYGTPYAEFVVSGKVTDSDDRGLQDIGVIVSKVNIHQRTTSSFIPDRNVITHEVRDTSRTSANGDFEYHYSGMPGNDSINIHIKFEDLSENARFEADSEKVTFFSSDLKGGEGWYEGRAEKKIDIKLKNKGE